MIKLNITSKSIFKFSSISFHKKTSDQSIFFLKKKLHKTNSIYNKNLTKRNFSNFGPNFNMGNTIKYVLIANTAIFIYGFTMQNSDYIKEFMFKKSQLSQGKHLSLVTTHFTKANTIDLIFDNLLIFLLSRNISIIAGEIILNQLVLSSILCSSVLLLLLSDTGYYIKSDAIIRGLIYYFVLSNPYQSFMVLFVPFPIKAMYLGIILSFMDILSGKFSNFGGLIASIILTKRIL